MEQHQRLKWARETAGYKTAADAARALGIPYPTYANHENASKSGFKVAEGRKYAKKFKVSFQWLMTNDGQARPQNMVPIVGYVGAGAEVFPQDQPEKGVGFDMVEAPHGVDTDTVAVVVRGDSMHPLKDGYLLFYSRKTADGVLDDYIGQLCVVQVHNGSTFVKELHQGSKAKLWTLISYNAPPIKDVRLDWAAPITDIRLR